MNLDPSSLADGLRPGLLLGSIGAASALAISIPLLKWPPPVLMRENFRGVRIPVVLGIALVAGATLASLSALVMDPEVLSGRATGSSLLIVVVLGAAGMWDDLRGDERPRGFSGHLGALRGGAVTGGIVKLVVGGMVGLAAGGLASAWDPVSTVLAGAAIALGANLINLFDRAPGRAGKAALLLAIPVGLLTSGAWIASAGGVLGPLVVLMWFDLRERAMLGDAGANPVGGMLGLGVVAFSTLGQVVAVVGLLALNLASERFSFGAAIEGNRFLRALDLVGRRDPEQRPPSLG